jgi:hypothetical protein
MDLFQNQGVKLSNPGTPKDDAGLSPASSLGVLRQIQHNRINLNGTRVVRGLSKINDLQSRILRALGVSTPDINSIDRQLELGL